VTSTLPPGIILLLGAIAVAAVARRYTRAVTVAILILAAVAVALLPPGDGDLLRVGDLHLLTLLVDDAGQAAALVLTLVLASAVLFGATANRAASVALLVAGAAALGVTLAGDVVSLAASALFGAVALAMLVWADTGETNPAAGQRFTTLHLMLGFALLVAAVAELASGANGIIGPPLAADRWSRWLMIAALASLLGAFPLGAWITDCLTAIRAETAPALIAITTVPPATALLRLFPGEDVLMYVGATSLVYAMVMGAIEGNVRRLLGYGVIHAAGVTLIATGLGGPRGVDAGLVLALAQACALALMAMALGTVLITTGRQQVGELGGLGRAMPVAALMAIIAGAAFANLPLTAGFAGLMTGIAAAREEAPLLIWLVWWVATAASVVHIAFRAPWRIFFGTSCGLRPPDANRLARWAMAILAVLLLAAGVFPSAVFALLPFAAEGTAITGAKLVAYGQLMTFAVLAWLLSQPLRPRSSATYSDVGWLWQAGGPKLAHALFALWDRYLGRARRELATTAEHTRDRFMRWLIARGRRHLGRSLSDQLAIVAVVLVLVLLVALT